MANNKKYHELLKDPRWQKKRLEIMQRDGFKCCMCGGEKSTLNVHHKYYIFEREPWNYPDNLLVTLCESCHESEEDFKEVQKDFIKVLLSKGYTNFYLSLILEQLQIMTGNEAVMILNRYNNGKEIH